MADFDINRLPAKPTDRVIKAKEMLSESHYLYRGVPKPVREMSHDFAESKGFVQDIGRTPNLHSAPGGHRWTLSFSSTLCGGISGSEYQFYG